MNINRGIFHGDALSPLLFVISLIPLRLVLRRMKKRSSFQKGKSKLNHLLFMDDLKLCGSNQNEIDSLVRTVEIVIKNIGMTFVIYMCGVLAMNRGKEVECNGIELENGEEIGQIGKGYKFLGILEKGDNIRKEYFKRLRATLKSKLNAKHVFQVINTWLVPTVRYSVGIIEWTKEEATEIDPKARKVIIMYDGIHLRSNFEERLHLPRSEGGRRLASIKYRVNDEMEN